MCIRDSTHGGHFVGTRMLTPEEVALRKKTDAEIQEAMDAVREAFRVKGLGLGKGTSRSYRGLEWAFPAERRAIKTGVYNLKVLEEARAIEVLPLPEPPKAPPAFDATAQKYQGEQGQALLAIDKRQHARDVARYQKVKAKFDETIKEEEAARAKNKQSAFKAMKALARRFPYRGRFLKWRDAAREAQRTRSVQKTNDQGEQEWVDVVKASYKVVDVEAHKKAALEKHLDAQQKKQKLARNAILDTVLNRPDGKFALPPSLADAPEGRQQYKQIDMHRLKTVRRANLDATRKELEVVTDQAVKDQLQKEQDEIAARKAAAAAKPVPWTEDEETMNQDRVNELEEIANAVKEGRYEEYKEMMEADATLRQIMTDEAELATLERGSVDYLLKQMKIRTDRWKYAKCKLPIKHTYARKQPPVLERPSFFAVLQHGLPKRAESNADDVFGTASAGEGAVTVAAGPSKRRRK